MKRLLLIIAAIALLVFVAIQWAPVERTNPPIAGEIDTPADVGALLRRSCYDCHSNETAWPWYSYVAPVSWLVTGDVVKGRRKLNFSEWGRLDETRRPELLEEIWDEVDHGEMPLANYLRLHPAARLSVEDRSRLRDWVLSAGGETSRARR